MSSHEPRASLENADEVPAAVLAKRSGQGSNRGPTCPIRLGVLLLQTAADRVQLGLRAIQRGVRRELPENRQRPIAAIDRALGGERERRPDLSADRKVEFGGAIPTSV